MKAVIVSGGMPPSKALLKREVEGSSLLICADSGANCLFEYEIPPHFLLGDFDSIDKSVLSYFNKMNCIIESYPKDKDYTDTHIALNKAIDLGAIEIILLGCTGSRIDHMLGNIGLLTLCIEKNIKAVMKDSNNTIFLSNASFSIRGKKGQYFSLIAYGGAVEDVTIEGAKFPLKEHNLLLGESIGLSNEFWLDEVQVSFKKGILLIIISND